MDDLLTSIRNEVDTLRTNLPSISSLHPDVARTLQPKSAISTSNMTNVRMPTKTVLHTDHGALTRAIEDETEGPSPYYGDSSLNKTGSNYFSKSKWGIFVFKFEKQWQWYTVLFFLLAIFFFLMPPPCLFILVNNSSSSSLSQRRFSYTRWSLLVTSFTLFIWSFVFLMNKWTR